MTFSLIIKQISGSFAVVKALNIFQETKYVKKKFMHNFQFLIETMFLPQQMIGNCILIQLPIANSFYVEHM